MNPDSTLVSDSPPLGSASRPVNTLGQPVGPFDAQPVNTPVKPVDTGAPVTQPNDANAKAVSSAEPLLARLEAGTFQVFHVAAAELRKLLAGADPFTASRVTRIRYWVTEIEQMPGDFARAIAKDLRGWADGLEPAAPATPSVTAVNTVTAAPAVIPFPVASATGITVKWDAVKDATGYRMDVSTDPDFLSIPPFVGKYQNLDVGSGTEHLITDLVPATKYYIRVRALSPTGVSANSNTVEVETPALPAPTTAFSGVDRRGTQRRVGGVDNRPLPQVERRSGTERRVNPTAIRPTTSGPTPAALTLSVSPSFLILGIGHSSTLDATASDPSALITFDSSDTRVATVSPSSGLVTGIAAGSATITARAGAVSAACSVSVT